MSFYANILQLVRVYLAKISYPQSNSTSLIDNIGLYKLPYFSISRPLLEIAKEAEIV